MPDRNYQWNRPEPKQKPCSPQVSQRKRLLQECRRVGIYTATRTFSAPDGTEFCEWADGQLGVIRVACHSGRWFLVSVSPPDGEINTSTMRMTIERVVEALVSNGFCPKEKADEWLGINTKTDGYKPKHLASTKTRYRRERRDDNALAAAAPRPAPSA